MDEEGCGAMSPDLERAYRVLGIDLGVSRAQLNAAYLGLVNRFDPSKFAERGGEFTIFAVRRLAEATAAFETVRGALDTAD